MSRVLDSSSSSFSHSDYPLKTIKEVIAFYYRYYPHSSDEENEDIDSEQNHPIHHDTLPHGPPTNQTSISVSNMKGKNAVISPHISVSVSGNSNRGLIGRAATSAGEEVCAMRSSLPNRWPSSLPFMQHRFKFLFHQFFYFPLP